MERGRVRKKTKKGRLAVGTAGKRLPGMKGARTGKKKGDFPESETGKDNRNEQLGGKLKEGQSKEALKKKNKSRCGKATLEKGLRKSSGRGGENGKLGRRKIRSTKSQEAGGESWRKNGTP